MKREKHKNFSNEQKNVRGELTGKESVMENNSTLVSMTDLQGRISYANDDFVHISGYSRDEMYGNAHSMVRHPAMPRSAFLDLWETIQSGNPWNGIVINRCKNGDYYTVEANVAPYVHNGKITGYTSVRRKPDRSRVNGARELYRKIIDGKAEFPWSDTPQLSIRTKFRLFVALWVLVFIGIGLLASFNIIERGLVFFGLIVTLSVIIIGVGEYLINYFLSPLKLATKIANDIATGDLSPQIPHNRNDEIGALYKGLLNMLINTAAIISKIKENSTVLHTSSDGLNEVSESLSAESEEMSVQAETIAAAATQMDANLQTISGAIEEMSITVAEVAKNTSNSVQIASSANEQALATNTVVKELGESAQKIGKIIETISDIASQTNLLALNAAIEAAGAGEAGRGFAVVADEVKNLARQTAKASEDIKGRVHSIQTTTQGSIVAIGSISQIIARINDMMKGIAAAAEEQSITTKEIARNIAGSVVASNEVTKNISGISSAARKSAKNAVHMSGLATQLNQMAEGLKTMVNRFSLSRK